jgi:Transketolase-like TK C-terminal domain
MAAWQRDRVVLVLSRQALPTLDRNKYASASGVAHGAYVLADSPGGDPEVILIASGSEVSLAVEAHEKLLAEGIRSRVVSMPSWEIFDHQTEDYRDNVLPPKVKPRVAVEQASTLGWERYVGPSGYLVGSSRDNDPRLRLRVRKSDDCPRIQSASSCRWHPRDSKALLRNHSSLLQGRIHNFSSFFNNTQPHSSASRLNKLNGNVDFANKRSSPLALIFSNEQKTCCTCIQYLHSLYRQF